MAQRPARARQLGVEIGALGTGAGNAITAVVPARVMAAGAQCPAAVAVGNGYGKLVGSTQVAELGVLETPILLTATLSAFRVADALVEYLLARPGYEAVQSINPVVGETNDGFLSDIRARPLRYEHVAAAIDSASGGPVAEGAVGAGTGTGALGFKAGVGTSSRVLPGPAAAVTVGALVQANFSGTLTVMGVPIPSDAALAGVGPGAAGQPDEPPGNSCVIVVATDAPLDARQLGRIARRALTGLARTGSDFSGGSGDYVIAFSTARPGGAVIPDADLDLIFRATIDAVEEAILNSLFMAETTTGFRGHVRYAVPHAWVRRARAAALSR
jgi:D-aminopeptidase